MRENRPYGSEGGVARAIPTPICAARRQGNGYAVNRMVRACSAEPWCQRRPVSSKTTTIINKTPMRPLPP
jgi:hypothetical protein